MKSPRYVRPLGLVFLGLVSYSSLTLAQPVTDSFNSTGTGRSGSIQQFVVPAGVTTVTIEAFGASGGGTVGGLGARMRGDFSVTPGETLNLIVAQQGLTTAQGNYAGGGGGASYIYRNANDTLPMIAAAGGGGGSQHGAGSNGSATETPTPGGVTGSGAGGAGGNGGAGGLDVVSGNFSTAGGGAGWLTDGQDGLLIRNPEGKGGQAPRNGALGGEFTHSNPAYAVGEAGNGGFGGAGGMSDNSGAGGGGGGFNGGGGGNNYTGEWGTGGGGGSYNGGTNQSNSGGVQSGDGLVTISYDGVPVPEATPVPTLSTWALIVFSMLLAFAGFTRIRRRV